MPPAPHLQDLGVVLQDLAVDEVAHLVRLQLAALKLKGQLADGLRHGLTGRGVQACGAVSGGWVGGWVR